MGTCPCCPCVNFGPGCNATIDLQYVTEAERHEKFVKEYFFLNSIEDNYCFLLLLFIIHVWAQSNHAKQLFMSTSNFTIVDIVHIM